MNARLELPWNVCSRSEVYGERRGGKYLDHKASLSTDPLPVTHVCFAVGNGRTIGNGSSSRKIVTNSSRPANMQPYVLFSVPFLVCYVSLIMFNDLVDGTDKP